MPAHMAPAGRSVKTQNQPLNYEHWFKSFSTKIEMRLESNVSDDFFNHSRCEALLYGLAVC